ncbi:MAG: cupin-like domain-containing protein [Pseudomonadota bacterium]|nr:cupin-like domain-containing protein [Pseudomonadota bacterium]
MPRPEPAAQWHDVDADLFERTIKPRGRPAILPGLARTWPATAAGRQSPYTLSAYLKTFYSGHPVPSFEAPPSIGGRFFYNESMDGFNFESKRASLNDVLDRLCGWTGNAGAPALYAGSVSLPLYLPGFSASNNARSLVTAESVLESIWIGNRTCIAAHFDNTENLACVVAGRRRFTMFPPDQIRNLYVGPLDLTPAGQPVSLVDIRCPDLTRFPRFAAALEVAEVAELEPGDAVYIPALWWHHVEALDDFNVLVNYWWRDVPDYFDSPSNSLLHCLLTIKSLPLEQRRRWQVLFDYLIFQSEEPALEHLPPATRGLFGDLTPAKAERIRSMLLKILSRKTP